MCYLYDDVWITYPHLVIAARKAESEHEDYMGESFQVKSFQAEGRNDIMKFSKQIAQLQLAVQKPQSTAISNLQQSGGEKDSNKKKGKN